MQLSFNNSKTFVDLFCKNTEMKNKKVANMFNSLSIISLAISFYHKCP